MASKSGRDGRAHSKARQVIRGAEGKGHRLRSIKREKCGETFDGSRERERERGCVSVCCLVKGGTRHPKRSFSRSRSHLVSPRFCPFFPFRPLFGRPVPLMPSLFSRSRTTPSPLKSQKNSTELSDEFGRVSSRNSTRGAVTVPVKKDRNVEKTRIRTLSGVKGRAPGPAPNEEEIVIPDGSFFPLNLDPLGGEPASPSDSERGPYLHLSSLIIFLPTIIAIPLSRSARCDLAQFWRSSMLCPGRHRRVSPVCPHRASCFSPEPQTLDTFTYDEHHRSPPARARIRLPFLSTPRRPRPR